MVVAIPDGGSTSLTSGLSSNFSGRGKIAPVWYNEINGHGAKVDGALYEMRPLEVCGIVIESQRFSCALPSVGGIPNIRLGNMFSRTIIYLDVAAAVGITWESLPPLPVVLGYHLKLPPRFSLRGSSLQSAQLMPLGLACPPSSLSSPHPRFFLQQESSPQGTVIAKPTIRSKSNRSGAIWELNPLLSQGRYPPAPSNEKSSSTVSTIRLHSLSGYLEMSESATAHCRRMVPSSGSTFAGGSWGLLSHWAQASRRAGPFLLSPSILPSNWESLPSGFGGVGGLGNMVHVDVRTSFRHFTIGTFAIFSPLVSHFCVSLHYHVYEGKKIVKLVLRGWMFTRLAFTRALTGADDHAHFILPKEVERVLDHRGSTCTPPSISTGVKGEGWILVFHVLDIKGFVVEPVPSPAPPESGFDPKVQ
uniref:Uncharacterized protein n=1 Tax=Fagus sylvatica TaxID=28930 RepID=A0A2N9FUD8_FAGSY